MGVRLDDVVDELIDSHVHFWEWSDRGDSTSLGSTLQRPWMHHYPLHQHDSLPRQLSKAIGEATELPTRFIHVQTEVVPEQAVDEVRWINELNGQHGVNVVGQVAWAPLDSDDLEALEQHLIALKGVAGSVPVVGIRRVILGETSTFPRRLLAGARLCGKHDLGVELAFNDPNQFDSVVQLVRECPETRFIVDHAAKPGRGTGLEIPQRWAECIVELAALDNCWVKLSGMHMEIESPDDVDERRSCSAGDLAPYLQHCISAFGWDRIVFGSDFPVSMTSSTYKSFLDAVVLAVNAAGGGPEEMRKVFSINAIDFYGLTAAAPRH